MIHHLKTSLNKWLYIAAFGVIIYWGVWYFKRFPYENPKDVPVYLGYMNVFGFLITMCLFMYGLVKLELRKNLRQFILIPFSWFWRTILMLYIIDNSFKLLDIKFDSVSFFNDLLQVNKVIIGLITILIICIYRLFISFRSQ